MRAMDCAPEYGNSDMDVYVPMMALRKYRLRPGDEVVCTARAPRENDRFWAPSRSKEYFWQEPREKWRIGRSSRDDADLPQNQAALGNRSGYFVDSFD